MNQAQHIGMTCLFVIDGVSFKDIVQAALPWPMPLRVEDVAGEGAADVTDDVKLALACLVEN